MASQFTSPHHQGGQRSARLMQWVLLAALPGLLVQIWLFGPGTLINLLLAATFAVALEAAILRLRRRPVGFYLRDYSALVTGLLLALALPPLAPWWLTLVAVSFAIVFAKHLYGGMGYNPFNPAMAGYALALISFPVAMTQWLVPGADPGLLASLGHTFEWGAPIDASTGATALDLAKHRGGQTLTELWQSSDALAAAHRASLWVNLAFLAGGVTLLALRVMSWHAPVAMLATLVLVSGLFYGGDPDQHASPWFHLTSGATMLGAFFIVTDPVTSATSRRGKLVYGACVGLLIYIIRGWGGYPDAVAFAVLLMNLAAPFIDQYTRPRSYGHKPKGR